MANVTDPLIVSIQGSDPQNLMEYITRQKIYDSRYWKEECFGCSVVDVLEKAVQQLITIGSHPTKFMCFLLKLLQLQPDIEVIVDGFIRQEEFKYVRALGTLYLRLVGRPTMIYEELEPLYTDFRTLRTLQNQMWDTIPMDTWIDQLLQSTYVVGITLPRLPSRQTLVEAGYLENDEEHHDLFFSSNQKDHNDDHNDRKDHDPDQFHYRPTALKDILQQFGGSPHEYLRYKVEQGSSAALQLYKERKAEGLKVVPLSREHGEVEEGEKKDNKPRKNKKGQETMMDEKKKTNNKKKKKKKKKKTSNDSAKYDHLFKKTTTSTTTKQEDEDMEEGEEQEDGEEQYSEEYWNEQRAKLGLKPLKK